jgi:DUF177 domain-containing protein
MSHQPPSNLDPRSPLVLETRDLPRRPGALLAVARSVPAPSDLGLELIGVPHGAELDLQLQLQSVSEGVYVSGTASGPLEGECGRCLRPISDHIDLPIQEFYAYPHSTTDETTDEDEVARLQGDLINLEPTLRDAVVLALPVNPVCREDCPGLCPDCGVPLDELPAGHNHEQHDPRWAALSQMKTSEE